MRVPTSWTGFGLRLGRPIARLRRARLPSRCFDPCPRSLTLAPCPFPVFACASRASQQSSCQGCEIVPGCLRGQPTLVVSDIMMDNKGALMSPRAAIALPPRRTWPPAFLCRRSAGARPPDRDDARAARVGGGVRGHPSRDNHQLLQPGRLGRRLGLLLGSPAGGARRRVAGRRRRRRPSSSSGARSSRWRSRR